MQSETPFSPSKKTTQSHKFGEEKYKNSLEFCLENEEDDQVGLAHGYFKTVFEGCRLRFVLSYDPGDSSS